MTHDREKIEDDLWIDCYMAKMKYGISGRGYGSASNTGVPTESTGNIIRITKTKKNDPRDYYQGKSQYEIDKENRLLVMLGIRKDKKVSEEIQSLKNWNNSRNSSKSRKVKKEISSKAQNAGTSENVQHGSQNTNLRSPKRISVQPHIIYFEPDESFMIYMMNTVYENGACRLLFDIPFSTLDALENNVIPANICGIVFLFDTEYFFVGNMAAIKSRNTKPELFIRKQLFALYRSKYTV